MLLVVIEIIKASSMLMEWAHNWLLGGISERLCFLVAHTFGYRLLFYVLEE
jgi:hypothetical protein